MRYAPYGSNRIRRRRRRRRRRRSEQMGEKSVCSK
jgi:hypothetical protein